MNEAGTVYYYVVSAANPTEPTPAELKAQTNTYGTGGSVTVAAKGSEAAAADTRARCHDAGGEYSVRVPHLFLFTDAEQAVDRDAVDGTRLGTRTEKAMEFRRERGRAGEVDEAQT